MNQSTKSIIIPSTDQERFIDFSAFSDGREWFGGGVRLSAISTLSERYCIRYPNPRKFLALVVFEGNFAAECDGFAATLEPGELLVMPPGAWQGLRALGHAEMGFWLLADDGRWPYRPVHRRVRPGRWRELMEMAWNESRSYGDGDTDETVARHLTSLLLAMLARECHAENTDAESTRGRLERLWRAIDRHPELPWTEEDMAKHCRVSVPHLHMLSRKFYHSGPGGIRQAIRFRHAEALLRHTTLPVAEIARRCGYEIAYSFARAFRRATGKLPGEYRADMPDSTFPASAGLHLSDSVPASSCS